MPLPNYRRLSLRWKYTCRGICQWVASLTEVMMASFSRFWSTSHYYEVNLAFTCSRYRTETEMTTRRRGLAAVKLAFDKPTPADQWSVDIFRLCVTLFELWALSDAIETDRKRKLTLDAANRRKQYRHSISRPKAVLLVCVLHLSIYSCLREFEVFVIFQNLTGNSFCHWGAWHTGNDFTIQFRDSALYRWSIDMFRLSVAGCKLFKIFGFMQECWGFRGF